MQVANFSYAEVKYSAGDIGYVISHCFFPTGDSHSLNVKPQVPSPRKRKNRSVESESTIRERVWCSIACIRFDCRWSKRLGLLSSHIPCTRDSLLTAAFELTGLGRGGQQIGKCRDTYRKAIEVLVELASLQVETFVPVDLKEHGVKYHLPSRRLSLSSTK